jgi:S-adenosylmethionine hydrolase
VGSDSPSQGSDTRPPLIALITDFGISDPYVGVVKGVIARHCPAAQCIDITHGVSPQQIRQGAYLLRTAYRHFPAHTVFLAVVDPGVGTGRRAIAIRANGQHFVGPDNGLFSAVLEDIPGAVQEIVSLRVPPGPISATFHGRDIFAPAAAHLACGVPLATLGDPVSDLVRIAVFRVIRPRRVERSTWQTMIGEVLHIDHFGNLVTTFDGFAWRLDGMLAAYGVIIEPARARLALRESEVSGIHRTYGAVSPGEALALIGSDGQIEIAVNGGSAADRFGSRIGDKVRLEYEDLQERRAERLE